MALSDDTGMTASDPARNAWRDPRFLRSHLGMLVFCRPDGSGFAQAEADQAPKNLVLARDQAGRWRLVRLLADPEQVPPREEILAVLADPARSTVLEGIEIERLPGPDSFALRREKLYLSAGKAPELDFKAVRRLSWEGFEATTPGPLAYQLWRPPRTMGGTQLVQAGLAERLGPELDAINLQLHWPEPRRFDGRPVVVWLHNDANESFTWCTRPERIQPVAAFVFVSHWQRQHFLATFPELPAERCHVIRNATSIEAPPRTWPAERPWRWRCAYTSAPDRGLSVLLDAWERLDPADAELHIWSSFRLWGPRFTDAGSSGMFSQARRLPGVTYHGIRPNAEVRAALRDMHFLTYPTTFDETSCLAAIEALAAGVRVIATARAAIPETTAGFAHLYARPAERDAHVEHFARQLEAEFRNPWGGRPALATEAQEYARAVYGWPACLDAWRALIGQLTGETARRTAPAMPTPAAAPVPPGDPQPG